MKGWSRIPQTPKKESQRPTEGDVEPRPLLKERNVVLLLSVDGVQRQTGNMCMNVELCKGSRPKEIIVTRTSRVQMLRNGGGIFTGEA